MKTSVTVIKLLAIALWLIFGLDLQAQPEGDLIAVVGTADNVKKVVLLNYEDGSFVNDDYYDLTGFTMGTIKHLIRMGNELWISDQTQDRIHRMDLEGNPLPAIGEGGGLDNLRGLRIINNEVWLANSGTQNSAPGNAIIRISQSGEIIGNYALPGSPWAFLPYSNDKALISFSTGGGFSTQIAEFDFAGNFIASFTLPGELNFIQQISLMQNGHYLASSFSNATGGYPSGVHQYDENGVYVATIGGTSGGGARGNWQLGNGNIVWTNAAGIHIANIATGTSSLIYAGQFHYAEKVSFGAGSMPLPFAEDFESGIYPPVGWIAYNPDGSAVEWIGSSTQNHTPGGQKSAFHNFGSPGTMEDGWLVTPAISLPEFWNVQLTFWSYNTWPTYYFKNSVFISTGDGNPLNGEFEEVWFAESVATSWEQSEVDLSDYAGQTVYVAFRYEGDNAHGWFLDDIAIAGEAPVLDPPTGLQAIETGNNVSLTWQAPVSKELLGYNVYRNDVKQNSSLVVEASYLDEALPAGTHFYGVTAVYSNGESPKAGPVSVLITGDFGKIQGFVRDAVTNKSIPLATLAASNTDNGAVSYSTPFGSHFMLLLPQGTYGLICSADGYEPMMMENVVVMNGMVKSFTFYLTPKSREILTGISQKGTNAASVYPNPASEYIMLHGNNLFDVQILSQSGLTVLNQKVEPGIKLDISRLPAGIYFVRMTSVEGVALEKLIIR